MSVYVVIAISKPEELGREIAARFDGAFFKLKGDTWLVDHKGTTPELADFLKIRSGESGSGLVLPVTNYNGRAPADLWEWLNVRMSEEK